MCSGAVLSAGHSYFGSAQSPINYHKNVVTYIKWEKINLKHENTIWVTVNTHIGPVKLKNMAETAPMLDTPLDYSGPIVQNEKSSSSQEPKCDQ